VRLRRTKDARDRTRTTVRHAVLVHTATQVATRTMHAIRNSQGHVNVARAFLTSGEAIYISRRDCRCDGAGWTALECRVFLTSQRLVESGQDSAEDASAFLVSCLVELTLTGLSCELRRHFPVMPFTKLYRIQCLHWKSHKTHLKPRALRDGA